MRSDGATATIAGGVVGGLVGVVLIVVIVILVVIIVKNKQESSEYDGRSSLCQYMHVCTVQYFHAGGETANNDIICHNNVVYGVCEINTTQTSTLTNDMSEPLP